MYSLVALGQNTTISDLRDLYVAVKDRNNYKFALNVEFYYLSQGAGEPKKKAPLLNGLMPRDLFMGFFPLLSSLLLLQS